MIAFGPVPSRRLGRSLGVNNIPPKFCTYACVYCQLGRTPNMQVKRERFHGSEGMVKSVKAKVTQAEEKGERIDYVAFVVVKGLKRYEQKIKPHHGMTTRCM